MPETLIQGGPSPDSLFLDGPPPPWPDWLETARIDDAVVDAAYENTPAQLRASINTGLALAFAHFGQLHQEADSVTRKPHAGFWFGEHSRAVPWCIIFMDATYAAAARLTAACVLPRLCDVPEIFAVVVGDGKTPPADNVLTALTLSGVEDVFCLQSSGARKLLEDMAADSAANGIAAPQGRAVLLHNGTLGNLAAASLEYHIPCFEENTAPGLAVLPESPCTAALLAFAHGNVVPGTGLAPDTQAVFAPAPPTPQDYTGNAAVAEAVQRGLLVLSPGCEGFWLHRGLEPSFFRVRGLATGLL